MQALVFEAKALRSPVAVSASASGAHVTAASALRVRWAEGATANGGVDGAAGSRAKHAAGRGDGRACTGAGSRVARTGDGRAAVRMPVRGEAGTGEAWGGKRRADAMPAAGAAGRGERGARRRRENRPKHGGQ